MLNVISSRIEREAGVGSDVTIEGYVICKMLIGSPERVWSDEVEYRACISAVDGLQDICDVEEKYENAIENHIEWESAISQHALRQMVSFDIGYNEVQESRKLIARKLFNLLASARLYLDSLPKHAKKILTNDGAALQRVKGAPSDQYDARLSYRVMEALRNYSQHSALPIHGITTHPSRNLGEEPQTLSFAVLPIIDYEQLAQDGSFKKSVLDEIGNLEKIELKPMVREYIEGLSAVHSIFRTAVAPRSKAWVAQLNKPTERFTEAFPGESTLALSVLPVDSRGLKAGEEVYIAGPIERYLEHMQKKYVVMVNFARRTVNF
jgi:hypothetical protein